MLQTSLLYPALIIISIVVIAFIAISLAKKRLRTKGGYSYSLGMGLIKIQLPYQTKTNEEKGQLADIREKIAMMEQVFSQLSAIKAKSLYSWFYGKPFFAFEVVVPHVGQQAIFFLAVPRRYLASAEKLIHGIYPDADLEKVQDYTIFHPHGAASAMSLKCNNTFLPLNTYQELESDPLGGLLNAFSKVAHEGEGLAMQVITRKANPSWNKKLRKIAKHMKEGRDLKEAIAESKKSDLSKSFKGDEQKAKEKERLGPVDEETATIIEKKSNRVLFETNIRLISSAPNQARSEELLNELAIPFNQFNREGLNTFIFKEEGKRAQQKTIYQYAFRIPNNKNRMILSSAELSSIVHLPNTILGASHVASIKAKMAAAPASIPREGLLLGSNSYRGVETEVRMTQEDRARHLYIIGQTGTGKTYFMRNMIIQDIEAGKGVCFIDPHGDTAEDILGAIPPHRLKDVIYFNPGDIERPMGINMLEYDPAFPEQKTFIINELLEIFNKLYDMKTAGGPMFEQYFRNATALVMDDPESGNTLLEINRVFVDKAFRDYKLSKTTSPLVKTFWKEVAEKAGGEASLQNIVPYISSKFDSFLSNEIMRPIVAQEKSSFKLRDVMDNQKILLINLSKGRLGELNSSLIGLIMVGKILMAAFSRVDLPEKDRKDFYLYADEFQNVSTTSIETILSEARKYKLGLIIAHQFIGQLTDEIKDAVFGNVGSMAAFRVGPDDAEFLEKQFAPSFTASDLMNIDNRNCYIRMLINGQTTNPFSMHTLKGKDSQAEVIKAAKEYSRNTYGRDRATVEAELMKKFASLEKKPPEVKKSPF